MAKIRLNEDAEVVKTIREGLKAKDGYCPCRIARTPENKCICEEFKQQMADPDFEGYCHCMLYYKEKDPAKEKLPRIPKPGSADFFLLVKYKKTVGIFGNCAYNKKRFLGNEVFSVKIGKTLREFALLTVGTVIVAAAVYFFMLPSHVSVGSGAALAMVLSNFIPLSVSAITMIMNIGLLIIGFLLVGPEFGVKTVYCSVLMPLALGVFELLLPNFQSITQDPLLDVICYILLVSVGLAILFPQNASSGGLDIVAKIMNKYLQMDMGKAMSVSGIAVALTSALCYDAKTVVLSVLGTYFGGIMVDHFIFGFNIKRRVCVISEQLDQIVAFVLHDLHSGATLNEIIGAYDNTPRREMITIVDKDEYKKLMEFIRKVDDKAFVTVYAVSEMRYMPKK